MPNRYVREAAIKSKAVNSLSWQGEVFWRRLLNVVDDFGRYSADADVLRADVFPRQLDKVREADISRLLAECEKAGLLYRFEADSKWFLVMNQWEQGRAKKSRYPEPPPNICKHLQTFVYGCEQMSPTPTPTPTLTPIPTIERESAAAGQPEKPVEPHYAEAVVPTWEEVKKMAEMPTCGVPEADARKFFYHYNANNLWQNKHGRPVNVLNSLIVWHNRSKTMDAGKAARPVRAAGVPSLAEVRAVVVEKAGNTPEAQAFAASYWQFWQTKNWKTAGGKLLDWRADLPVQIAKNEKLRK
jgi:hypothetical protein